MDTEAVVQSLLDVSKTTLLSRTRVLPAKYTAFVLERYDPTKTTEFELFPLSGETKATVVFDTTWMKRLPTKLNTLAIQLGLTTGLFELLDDGIGFAIPTPFPPRPVLCVVGAIIRSSRQNQGSRRAEAWLEEQLKDVFDAIEETAVTVCCGELALSDPAAETADVAELRKLIDESYTLCSYSSSLFTPSIALIVLQDVPQDTGPEEDLAELLKRRQCGIRDDSLAPAAAPTTKRVAPYDDEQNPSKVQKKNVAMYRGYETQMYRISRTV
ncbi:hypothetical protein C8R43DRAFT_959292 [Mycena crocata]|nr:hypothetical protein C8R43DRAFT_959292 [Mycena crocata]